MNRQRNESESEGKKLRWGKKINMTASFSLRSHFFIPLCQYVSGFLFLCGSASWCASQCRKEQTFFFLVFACAMPGKLWLFSFPHNNTKKPFESRKQNAFVRTRGPEKQGRGDGRCLVCMCEWLSAGSINQQSGNQSRRLLTSSSQINYSMVKERWSQASGIRRSQNP